MWCWQISDFSDFVVCRTIYTIHIYIYIWQSTSAFSKDILDRNILWK